MYDVKVLGYLWTREGKIRGLDLCRAASRTLERLCEPREPC